jgi:hypothetical protein
MAAEHTAKRSVAVILAGGDGVRLSLLTMPHSYDTLLWPHRWSAPFLGRSCYSERDERLKLRRGPNVAASR